MDKSRRKAMLTIGGGAAAVGLLGPAMIKGVGAGKAEAEEIVLDENGKVIHQPLPYVPLDPAYVGDRAYNNYFQGDCMYAGFNSIVEALAEQVGEPVLSYPSIVTKYGAGGVMGWATLCGACNGAAMAIYLVSSDPLPLIDEVFGFYQATALPNYYPTDANFTVASSVAESPLCHVSVSRWCDASGLKAFSPERSERCAQLVSSVAKFTVEVLNAQAAGTFVPTYPIPADVQHCRSCHDFGGKKENTRGKMDCITCHTDKATNHH